MSRLKLEELLSGVSLGRQVQVDLGKLGEVKFLNAYLKAYMRPGAERLAPEKLGRRIDDGLVECIWLAVWRLEGGGTGAKEFESTMDTIEEGIKAHPALLAFEMSLPKGEEGVRPPLPSGKYLELARRRVRHGAKKGPSARVLLAPFMNEARWETDWDRERIVRGQAVDWLGGCDLAELRYYILASDLSPVAWDTLKAICQQLAARGEEDIPRDLLMWNLWADYGLYQRPAEVPAPRPRLRKLGYILRDNEIRHTVDLLIQVGMPKTAACQAVAKGTVLEPTTVGMPKTVGRQAVAKGTLLEPITID